MRSRREVMAGAAALWLPSRGAGAARVRGPDGDAPDAPAARISNGLVSATLYLPDAERGYYRATRFDWSGVIADLQAGGHSYFGRWFAGYDPKKHDAIAGPVQEYVTGQGFDAAQAGETFVKLGVGVLRKPAAPIRGFPTLEIVDGGRWRTRVHRSAVDFFHEVQDPRSGYGYRYRKTVELVPGARRLVLRHRLESTGVHPIDTEMYDHNFFVLDGARSGPDIEVRFPFRLEASDVRGDPVSVEGNRIGYLGPIATMARMQLRGFGPSAADYDIRVENRRTGAGVRVTADRPLSDLVFWTSPRTTCPEAYIHVHAERSRPMEWTIRYDFYAV